MAKETEECFVCGLVRHCEQHHLLPKQVGGEETFPLCLSCHEHVDRTPLKESYTAMRGTWAKLNAGERLLCLKFIRIMADMRSTILRRPAVTT